MVAEAADGHAAVEEAAAHHPDVALVDIRMPVCDGLAAIAPLLARRAAALSPLRAVTDA